MKTHFGELQIADAHLHFFSRKFFGTIAGQLPQPPDDEHLEALLSERLGFEVPPADPLVLASRWVQELDAHGVARAVAIASVPADESSVAAAAKAHPDRFSPYFMLNPKAPGALERVKRGFSELGLKGMCLFPAMHHFYPWDAELTPMYEIVAEAGGLVFIHCGQLKMGIRDKLGLPSPFDIRFASPLEIAGVARRFPSVPFVVPHFGGGFFRELLLVADECANVYTDSSSSNAWMDRLAEPMTLDRVFERALAVMGPSRILYGSDSSFFPRGWQRSHFEKQAGVLHDLGVSTEDAQAILGGNLTRIAF